MSHFGRKRTQASSSRSRAAGFTLFEIVIVLLIVGLITAGITAMTTGLLRVSKTRATNDNAALVQQSLQRFLERYGRLPCPALRTLAPGAPGYGIEDTATTDVTTSCGATKVATGPANQMARGVLPWITLGLPLEQVQDGYSRMFSYHVAIGGTTTNANTAGAMRGTMTVHTATPIALGTGGNQINACAAGDDLNACNMRAAVVLVSHGENGFGGFTAQGQPLTAPTDASEIENTDNNVNFVKGEISAVAFDDSVYAWSPDELIDPLSRQGTIKSGSAITNDLVRNTAIAISNKMVTDAAAAPTTYPVPATSPVALPNDPWGAALTYTTTQGGAVLCTLAATTTVFTVSSLGIDGVANVNLSTGRNDDVSVPVTVDLLKAQVNNRPSGGC